MSVALQSLGVLLLLHSWALASAQSDQAPTNTPEPPPPPASTEVRFPADFRALSEGAFDAPAAAPANELDGRLQLTAGPLFGLGAVPSTRTGGGIDYQALIGLQAAVQYGLTPKSAVRAVASFISGATAKSRLVATQGRSGQYVDDEVLPMAFLFDLEYSIRPKVGPVRLSLAGRLGYVGEVGSPLVSGAFMGGAMLGMAFLLGRAERIELHTRGGLLIGSNDRSTPPHFTSMNIPLELSLLCRFL